MADIRTFLCELVRTPVNFMLVGPTGAGKDQFARAFHRASTRSTGPFFSVNCAAIPESLFESQVFGYRKGAFTGADSDRPGIFETAAGGFVLLNEITDAPLSVQTKLLQAIEERQVWRVGDPSPRKIDVWIAAATNRIDLNAACDQGLLRRDLYFRLARMLIRIPALCNRSGDIPELVDHLVARVSSELGREPIGFSDAALRALSAYSWPGNVRELENLVHTLILTHEGSTIDVQMLPECIRGSASGARKVKITRNQLKQVLSDEEWNVTRAAVTLGISREYVHALARRFGLARPARFRRHRTASK